MLVKGCWCTLSRKLVLILVFLTLLIGLGHPRFQQNSVGVSDGYPVHNLNTGLNYTTIQEAINANETLDGQTIHVDAGTYNFIHTEINKSVSVIGAGRENTTILGASWSETDTVLVTADNVTISGFTLRDGVQGVGTLANYTHILNCNISYNQNGIGTESQSYLFGAEIIEGNIIMNNTFNGIGLLTWNYTIRKNIIYGNGWGIYLNNPYTPFHVTSDSAQIYENTIENNHVGCVLQGSYNHTIYYNNFLNNTVQAMNSYPYSTNELRENYWSDYNGTDSDQDGIGDTPYIIDANNTDHYPLMGTFQSFNVSNTYGPPYPPNAEVDIISNATIGSVILLRVTDLNSPANIGFYLHFYDISGLNGTISFCRITFPLSWLNSSYYPLAITSGQMKQSLSRIIYSNGTSATVYFTLTLPVEAVDIYPEFPSFLFLPLFMVAASVAVIVYKRKRLI